MTIKEVKEWLNRARYIDNEVNSLIRERERIFELATSTTGAWSEDKIQSSGGNSTEKNMIKYAEYSETIDNRIGELVSVKAEIIAKIDEVEDHLLRSLLINRYINFWNFEQIACDLTYSYKQTCRLHGKALEIMKDVLECPIEPVL